MKRNLNYLNKLFMKYLYILLAAFFSIQCFGQKIKKSEIDTFSGKANIETSIVPIKQRLTDGAGVFFKFRNSGDILLSMSLYNQGNVIGSDDKIMIKTSDGEVYELLSIDSYVSRTNIVSGMTISSIEPTYAGDSYFFKDKLVTDIRVYFTDGYVDFEVKEKAAKKIQKAYNLILEEINKYTK